MGNIIRTLWMITTAVVTILFVIWLQQFGDWTILLISIILIIAFIHSMDKLSRKWKCWFISVLVIPYLSSSTGLRVRKTEEGRIQLVRTTYPICPRVYIEGSAIDTIELATGYITFAGWYYNVHKSKYYAIRDSNHLTTIVYNPPFGRVFQGREMRIEKYRGLHGNIDVFSYIDDKGKRVRRDFFGKDPDAESYTIDVLDNAEYLPEYIP